MKEREVLVAVVAVLAGGGWWSYTRVLARCVAW